MARLTRPKDQFSCRIANCEIIEDWLLSLGGDISNMCNNCPIEIIANKLAKYEDKYETLETQI